MKKRPLYSFGGKRISRKSSSKKKKGWSFQGKKVSARLQAFTEEENEVDYYQFLARVERLVEDFHRNRDEDSFRSGFRKLIDVAKSYYGNYAIREMVDSSLHRYELSEYFHLCQGCLEFIKDSEIVLDTQFGFIHDECVRNFFEDEFTLGSLEYDRGE